jgi:hypothetical protein
VNGVSNHNSISNFTAPIVASGQTISANEVVATTSKASTIQPLDGPDETLVIRANFITRPIGSTLQLAPDQVNATSTVSSQSNISAGTDVTAVGNIVSATGKIEAVAGAIIGASSSISTRLTCESIHVSNGSYDDQEIKCGRLTLSSGQHDGWSILQGENGSGLQDTLGIVMPNANGALTVYDENNNPLLIQSKLGLISQTVMNQNADLFVSNGNANLASASSLLFGAYTFRPQRYTLAFSGATIDNNPNTMFNTGATWTNVNTNSTSQLLATSGGDGHYMMNIEAGASSGGTYGAFRFSCEFPFVKPAFSVGTVTNRYDGNFSMKFHPIGLAKPWLCSFSSGGADYKLCWSSVPNGTETFSGTITLTTM